MLTHAQYKALKAWPDGQSCGHPGCLSHITHPCEKCGRIAGHDSDAIREYEEAQSKTKTHKGENNGIEN